MKKEILGRQVQFMYDEPKRFENSIGEFYTAYSDWDEGDFDDDYHGWITFATDGQVFDCWECDKDRVAHNILFNNNDGWSSEYNEKVDAIIRNQTFILIRDTRMNSNYRGYIWTCKLVRGTKINKDLINRVAEAMERLGFTEDDYFRDNNYTYSEWVRYGQCIE